MLETLTSTILDNLDAALGQYAFCMETPAQQREARAELSEKITMKKLERTRLSDRVRGLYENLTLGMIGKDEYFDLRERYDAQLAQINSELEQLDRGLAALDAQMKKYQSIRRDAQSIRKDRALTAELIDRLIERIDVTTEKQITVRFKFQTDYESYGEVIEKCKAM